MPKVSVVIPTHNRASFLRSAIQSVLNQTFQDFEIIVVDDASEDETPEVIQSFTDPRIQYVRHETNKGQGVTRNNGMSRVSGEYVAFLDDDDEWLPQKLEQQVSLLDSTPARVGLVYTGFRKTDALTKQVIAEVIPEKRGDLFDQMAINNWIGTCSTVVVRSSVFEKAGLFDEGLASGADYDMWLRISKEFAIEYICEHLVRYTVHDNRISTNFEAQIRGIERQLEKYAPVFVADAKSYSRRYFFRGVLLLQRRY